MFKFYQQINTQTEFCYYIETLSPLTEQETSLLVTIIGNNQRDDISHYSFLNSSFAVVLEVGPRLTFATPYSTNAISICRSSGLDKVVRFERSVRYGLANLTDQAALFTQNHSRMTEMVYPHPLMSFEITDIPAEPHAIPIINDPDGLVLQNLNREMGLGFDTWDLAFNTHLFQSLIERDPTDVEVFQLSQMNSEHCRHWVFKGALTIDGKPAGESLMQIVQGPLRTNPSNSLIAFHDNSSAIRGFMVQVLFPETAGAPSLITPHTVQYHPVFTAETHNFPSGVAPFPGAETGTGGRIRDIQATGRGGLTIAGTTGYCVGNLTLPGHTIRGERHSWDYPPNLASPSSILIKASDGASDYGNKYGEPVVAGFTRSFGLILPNGSRTEWIKPIMFSAGIGQIDDRHLQKMKPQIGMLILQVGGPAYRIGVGGGSASSMIQGDNTVELDFNAVQRGDAEMAQKVNRVIRTCIEMGDHNPILSIHDQGAGGPCNVITELVEPAGGRIDIRNISIGDTSLSVLEIWGAEYQERNALLVYPKDLSVIQKICRREKVNLEVLGEVTGDGHIVVYDSKNETEPVNLPIEHILANVPQKAFSDQTAPIELTPLTLPTDTSIAAFVQQIFRLPAVGSKGFLVHKVDRSVSGLVAQQQCCGPLQLPVGDYAVTAQSHLGSTGIASSIGEQPIKMLLDPAAGARMAVGEALTNLAMAQISDLEDVKVSLNWMWPAKFRGEVSRMHKAATAVREIMEILGIAIDGGKDSLSMATRVEDEIVKSPGSMVVSTYVTMTDITRKITPDLKSPGASKLRLIDLSDSHQRLGGSAFAQIHHQIGDTVPDVTNPMTLRNGFLAVQELIKQNLILSGHDRSDGGLITTLVEMATAGNVGITIHCPDKDIIPWLFNEELGIVIEYQTEDTEAVLEILNRFTLSSIELGTTHTDPSVLLLQGKIVVLKESLLVLREWWESTSTELEKLQTQFENGSQSTSIHYTSQPITYQLSYTPKPAGLQQIQHLARPKIAIIREEGSNGDREMASAFYLTGFSPWDITMTDLLNGSISLDQFSGIAFVGGFSYADVLGSAIGWANVIQLNENLRQMFNRFYNRPDTFSLGICNGCQLMAHLGWIPGEDILLSERIVFGPNDSNKFESRWVGVKIQPSPAIMLQGMTGSILGVWVAHREGRTLSQRQQQILLHDQLTPVVYVDQDGDPTESYPYNPNGSIAGIAGVCSRDGRHLAMMPHPERAFLPWQWPWMPPKWKDLNTSPWLEIFHNAYDWCRK